MPNNCAAIVIAAKHHELTKVKDTRGTTNTVGALRCRFDFRTADWDHSVKTAMFCKGDALLHPEVADNAIVVPLDGDDECAVPYEVLVDELPYSVGVWGVTDSGLRIVSRWLVFGAQLGCYTDGNAPEDPDPTIYEQILMTARNAVDVADAVTERANNGEFDGVGIIKSEINTSGELVLTYSDGKVVNVGAVLPPIDDALSAKSTNPVQNKVIYENVNSVLQIANNAANDASVTNKALENVVQRVTATEGKTSKVETNLAKTDAKVAGLEAQVGDIDTALDALKTPSPSLRVNLNLNEDWRTFTADKTSSECIAAFENGVPVIVSGSYVIDTEEVFFGTMMHYYHTYDGDHAVFACSNYAGTAHATVILVGNFARVDLASGKFSQLVTREELGHVCNDITALKTQVRAIEETVPPEVTTDDNGKLLQVIDGKWDAADVEVGVSFTDDGEGNVKIEGGEGGAGGSTTNAVLYTPQELTEEQKAQARENIGLDDVATVAQLNAIDITKSNNFTAHQASAAMRNLNLFSDDCNYDIRVGSVQYNYLDGPDPSKYGQGVIVECTNVLLYTSDTDEYYSILNFSDSNDGFVKIRGIIAGTKEHDAVNVGQLNAAIGDIETALDELHAYAQALVNGGATE